MGRTLSFPIFLFLLLPFYLYFYSLPSILPFLIVPNQDRESIWGSTL